MRDRKRRTSAPLKDSLAESPAKRKRLSDSSANEKPDTSPDPPSSLTQNAAGQWEVCLRSLPKGSSAKGLRAFLGEGIAPMQVQLDAAAREAVLTFGSRASAESCLHRYGGLSAAIASTESLPGGKRRSRRERQPREKITPPSQKVKAANAPVKQVESAAPLESCGFSESEDEGGSRSAGVPGPPQAAARKVASVDRLQELTRQIAAFAAQRRAKDAARSFEQLVSEGLTPSVQAYASLINAYVNSGDMSGAAATFSKMSTAGIRPNVVVCTALLKGYCRLGDMPGASSVLERMESQDPPVRPDVRLINTLLRGCVRVGDLPTARSVFSRLDDWKLEADTAACQFMGSLLGQGLSLKGIGQLLRMPVLAASQEKSQPSATASASSSASSCRFWAKGKCSKGSACPFFHDPALGQERVRRLEPDRLHAVASLNLDRARAAALLGRALVCRRALRSVDAALQAAEALPAEKSRGPSKELRESNRREQQLEVKLLRMFMSQGGMKGSGCKLGDFFGRCFLLRDAGGSREKIARALVNELASSWGLGRCRHIDRGALTKHYRSCFTEDGRICWNGVFPPGSGEAAAMPVKLELGAGSGEWVAAHAKLDVGKANWAALELMRDRAHSIFRRATFQALQNLCVFSGDAGNLLSSHFPDGCVAHVFVNFPEPPFVSGDEAAESSHHMLSAEVFMEMHRVLRKGGQVTILSDNGRYLKSLASTVANLPPLGRRPRFKSASPDTLRSKGKTPEYEEVSGVHVYHGWPDAEAGHKVRASSYFDTLWQRGSRIERFYIVISKG